MKTILKKIFKRKLDIQPLTYLPEKKPFQIPRAVKSKYIVNCALTFEGKAIRTVEFEIEAYSRAHARSMIMKGTELKVIKTYKVKRKVIKTNKIKRHDRNH